MLAALAPGSRDAIAAERPDWVLVYGDTNSTLGGARAAVAAAVPLAHVEAGLRSYDLSMPEEHNRIETDRLSQLLFAPDERSRATLEDEGIAGRVEVVGDVMMDANLRLAPIARRAVVDPRAARRQSRTATSSRRCTERRTSSSLAWGGSCEGLIAPRGARSSSRPSADAARSP